MESIGVNRDLPEWASYVAIDKNGDVYVYEGMPHINKKLINEAWIKQHAYERHSFMYNISNFYGDWESSVWKIKIDDRKRKST